MSAAHSTAASTAHFIHIPWFNHHYLQEDYFVCWHKREEKPCKHRPMDRLLSVATMHQAWSMLSEREVPKTTIMDERVGVLLDVDDWIKYIGDQGDVLEEMHFPRCTDDHPYILIARADEIPCGARSWCEIAQGFANNMQNARTLLYNWTFDVALVGEHETDLLRVRFGEKPKEYNEILTGSSCCAEDFRGEPLSFLEAIALDFVTHLVYKHFMKFV